MIPPRLPAAVAVVAPTALPPTALLIAAHGDGGADPRDAAVRALADALSDRLDLPVAWATLKRPETFAAARDRLGAAASRVAVHPLFMAEGLFVRERLPARLAAAGFVDPIMLPVFGRDPRLVDLIERRLVAVAAAAGGREPRDFRLVLVAHGSAGGDPGPRSAAAAIAAALGRRLGAAVHLGFVEEAPRLAEAIGVAAGEIVVGLFVSVGTHALDDVAARVAAVDTVIHHVAALGDDPGVADLVEAALADLRAGPSAR